MNVVKICLANIDKLCFWTRVSFRMPTLPWRTEFPFRRMLPKLLPVFSELGIQIGFTSDVLSKPGVSVNKLVI